MADANSPDLSELGSSPERAAKKTDLNTSESQVPTPQVTTEQMAVNDQKKAQELAEARAAIKEAKDDQQQAPPTEQPEPKPKGPVTPMPIIAGGSGHHRVEDLDNIDPSDVLDNNTRGGRNRRNPLPGIGRGARGAVVGTGKGLKGVAKLLYAARWIIKGSAWLVGRFLYEKPINYVTDPGLRKFLELGLKPNSIGYQFELINVLKDAQARGKLKEVKGQLAKYGEASKAAIHRS